MAEPGICSWRARKKRSSWYAEFASWLVWALVAVLLAAAAPVGVRNVSADLATFIRTSAIIIVLGGILATRGLFHPLSSISIRTYLWGTPP
jgi:transporter family protein